MNAAPVVALLALLPLCVTAAALPPGTSITFGENPNHEFNAPDGTNGEGIAYGLGVLGVTTNDALTYTTTAGGDGCSIAGTGNGDPAFYDRHHHLPRTSGTGANATTTVYHYVLNEPPYCFLDGQTPLGAGRIESLSYHRGFYYGLWRSLDSTDLYLRKYDPDWNLKHEWFLATYGTTSYTGPQGLSFYGDMLVMPRVSTSTDDYGMEYWQFPANGGPQIVGSTTNLIWYNQAIVRYDIASEGLDIIDDLEDGAASPHAWFVGRNAGTGQGSGNTGVARYDLFVTLGTYDWITPPVTAAGTPQVIVDQDNAEPEGIAVDDTHVYVTYADTIEKWLHDGSFVTSRNVSSDLPGINLGGATLYNGDLYVTSTNAPALPRAATILRYDPGDLSLIDSRQAFGQGDVGGIGEHDDELYILMDRDVAGGYVVQRYEPVTLDFLGEASLGYSHEARLQGASFVHHGSTVYLYAAHDTPDDPYAAPGVHVWKSLNNGATWTFNGTASYTTWTNPGDAGRAEYATQDFEFGCRNNTPYVWSVGRDDAGEGFGSWVRHAVNDPGGFLDCINPPAAALSISTDVHAEDGTASGSTWAFPIAVPGQTAVESSTYLKVTNNGIASGTVRVDLDDWTGAGTIPVANNLVYRHGTGATPAAVSSWTNTGGGAEGSADLPVPASSTLWIQFRIQQMPAVQPDGSYTAALAASDQS